MYRFRIEKYRFNSLQLKVVPKPKETKKGKYHLKFFLPSCKKSSRETSTIRPNKIPSHEHFLQSIHNNSPPTLSFLNNKDIRIVCPYYVSNQSQFFKVVVQQVEVKWHKLHLRTLPKGFSLSSNLDSWSIVFREDLFPLFRVLNPIATYSKT